jgi:mannosylglucosylglycerate synthase
MEAHARIFKQMGYPVTIIAGRGSAAGLPDGVDFELIPALDTQDEQILAAGKILEAGQVPQNFTALTNNLRDSLAEKIGRFDNLIVHNIFTKHFNLPLTTAVFELLDAGVIYNCIAWHHDFTWTSPRSRSKVHPGYPWNYLRTYRPDVTHVTVSLERREELAGLYDCPEEAIHVIYNGVDPREMFGLTGEGWELIQRLDLLAADLLLLMPVRVTRLKNVEYALAVVRALKEQGLAVKLVLTGPPDPHDDQSMAYFHSLQKLRDDLGLKSEMHFVFESGPAKDQPYIIGLDVVADLYRIADLLFMPSRQEGFGMPVLEAGLLGIAVAASTAVPAATEIGGEDVLRFDLDQPPQELAGELWAWAETDKRVRLARRNRQKYTWQAIFERDIEPLLHKR